MHLLVICRTCAHDYDYVPQLQMEAYASERADILNRNRDVEREMRELAQKYASLLGHQNQKQKIRHIERLKEENLKLKQV